MIVNEIEPSLTFSLTSSTAINERGGVIGVRFGNGRQPHTISWVGPVSNSIRTPGNQYDIINLLPGDYAITVTDADGCFSVQRITVGNRSEVFGASLTSSPSKCDANGMINVAINYGVAPYHISWSGPISGSLTTSDANTDISLPAGTYIVTIKDATGETQRYSAIISIATSDLYCSSHPTNVMCNTDGSIFVIINGGTAPYQLKWDGPSAGGTTVFDDFTITNLPVGTYTLSITDAEGCSVSESASVGVDASNLKAEFIVTPGTIFIGFQSGAPTYTISYSGPVSGSVVFAGNNQISNLKAGQYNVTITDAKGCTLSGSVNVSSTSSRIVEEQHMVTKPAVVLTEITLEKAEVATEVKQPTIYNAGITTDNTTSLSLGQNFPNPFLSVTTIPFAISESMEVQLLIHDSYGNLVEELQRDFSAGSHQFEWASASSAKGIYYYTIIVGTERLTKRMLLIQ